MSDNNGAPEKETTRPIINRIQITDRVDELAHDLRTFIGAYYEAGDIERAANDEQGRIVLTEAETVKRMSDIGVAWPLALSMLAGELLVTVAVASGASPVATAELAARSVDMLETVVEGGLRRVNSNVAAGEAAKRRAKGH